MRISSCTTKLFAQPSWLWKNNIELWHYQNCDIIRTADTKLMRQIKHTAFAKQNWKLATFALRAMIFWGVRLANHLTTAGLTFSTKSRVFLPLHATVGICWGLSDFHEANLRIAGSNKISKEKHPWKRAGIQRTPLPVSIEVTCQSSWRFHSVECSDFNE